MLFIIGNSIEMIVSAIRTIQIGDAINIERSASDILYALLNDCSILLPTMTASIIGVAGIFVILITNPIIPKIINLFIIK